MYFCFRWHFTAKLLAYTIIYTKYGGEYYRNFYWIITSKIWNYDRFTVLVSKGVLGNVWERKSWIRFCSGPFHSVPFNSVPFHSDSFLIINQYTLLFLQIFAHSYAICPFICYLTLQLTGFATLAQALTGRTSLHCHGHVLQRFAIQKEKEFHADLPSIKISLGTVVIT